MPQPTAIIITLGCRLNQADSAYIAEQLHRLGFHVGKPWEPAALVIVNSCTVTGEAGRKSRQAVRAARRRCPGAFIVIAGCDAQVDRQAWTAEASVDLVLGNDEKHRLIEYLPATMLSSHASLKARVTCACGGAGASDAGGDLPAPGPLKAGAGAPVEELSVGYYPHRTRANLKIQEGCDFFCSFCVVPYARGRPRSRPAKKVIEEALVLLERGHRELVLTGVNLSLYNDCGRDLPDLLAELSSIDGDFRLRLSSVEPGPIVPPLIELIKEQPRICRFLHLPLQYGENNVLRAMNRRYAVEEYKALAKQAMATVPDLCLGTDIIVGFPGETDAAFDTCLETVDELAFGNLHVFRYSPRPGTPAANFAEPVPVSVAEQRYRRLHQLGKARERDFALAQTGARLQVLIENTNPKNSGSGWSDNYLRVRLGRLPKSMQGEFAYARITAAGGGRQMVGEIENHP